MKLIFLDIDGVLNTYSTYSRERCVVEGDKLDLVAALAKESGAEIVLSSSWRLAPREAWEREFTLRKLEIFGVTPRLEGGNRRKEILSYMEDLDCVDSFVIFDDLRGGWGVLASGLVFVDGRRGISKKNILKAEKLLALD